MYTLKNLILLFLICFSYSKSQQISQNNFLSLKDENPLIITKEIFYGFFKGSSILDNIPSYASCSILDNDNLKSGIKDIISIILNFDIKDNIKIQFLNFLIALESISIGTKEYFQDCKLFYEIEVKRLKTLVLYFLTQENFKYNVLKHFIANLSFFTELFENASELMKNEKYYESGFKIGVLYKNLLFWDIDFK